MLNREAKIVKNDNQFLKNKELNYKRNLMEAAVLDPIFDQESIDNEFTLVLKGEANKSKSLEHVKIEE
jgi:hypothetical protein